MVGFVLAALTLNQLCVSLVKISKCFVRILAGQICTLNLDSAGVLFAELTALEDTGSGRMTRILTTDFPQYFAVVSRIRQEVHAIGPEGGMVSSSVVPQVQAVFPQGALTKKIKVGLQVNLFKPRKGTSAGMLKKITVNHIPKKKRFSLVWWTFLWL